MPHGVEDAFMVGRSVPLFCVPFVCGVEVWVPDMASGLGPGFAAPAAIERVITTVAEMQRSAECWHSHKRVIPVSTVHAIGERRGKRRG